MNVTGILTRADVPHALHSFGDYEVYKVDFAELGILAAAAHELINIPAGKVFVDGFAIVTGAAASSGAATVAFSLGSFSFGSAVGKAALVEGAVIALNPGATGGAVSKLSGDTPAVLKVTVGTAALTDLKLLIAVKTVDYDRISHLG